MHTHKCNFTAHTYTRKQANTQTCRIQEPGLIDELTTPCLPHTSALPNSTPIALQSRHSDHSNHDQLLVLSFLPHAIRNFLAAPGYSWLLLAAPGCPWLMLLLLPFSCRWLLLATSGCSPQNSGIPLSAESIESSKYSESAESAESAR
jgi:hypothetical protein